jgi:putative ABC transport system ATP-binding protein
MGTETCWQTDAQYPDSALISARNLCRVYRMGDQTVQALAGVNLDIASGEHVAIVGPSGSGKSTLMNLIGGLDRPSAGELTIAGQALSRLPDAAMAQFRNRTIGFVFQSFNLLSRLNAQENVELPMVYAGVDTKARKTRAKDLLNRVGLGQRLDHRPSQLSGGQQQRVAIARALAAEPRLLLADEPTGALDTRTGQEILALFADLNAQGMTVIVVTHDLEVAQATRRIIEMRDGLVQSERRTRIAEGAEAGL